MPRDHPGHDYINMPNLQGADFEPFFNPSKNLLRPRAQEQVKKYITRGMKCIEPGAGSISCQK